MNLTHIVIAKIKRAAPPQPPLPHNHSCGCGVRYRCTQILDSKESRECANATLGICQDCVEKPSI